MSDYNNQITCPKCGHNENSPTSKKCEICGFTLQKSGLPIPALVIGGFLLLGLGAGGFYTFKDQILGSQQADSSGTPTISPTPSAAASDTSPASGTSNIDTTNFLSRGERLLS